MLLGRAFIAFHTPPVFKSVSNGYSGSFKCGKKLFVLIVLIFYFEIWFVAINLGFHPQTFVHFFMQEMICVNLFICSQNVMHSCRLSYGFENLIYLFSLFFTHSNIWIHFIKTFLHIHTFKSIHVFTHSDIVIHSYDTYDPNLST